MMRVKFEVSWIYGAKFILIVSPGPNDKFSQKQLIRDFNRVNDPSTRAPVEHTDKVGLTHANKIKIMK